VKTKRIVNLIKWLERRVKRDASFVSVAAEHEAIVARHREMEMKK
jgi:hypothetical protein